MNILKIPIFIEQKLCQQQEVFILLDFQNISFLFSRDFSTKSLQDSLQAVCIASRQKATSRCFSTSRLFNFDLFTF